MEAVLSIAGSDSSGGAGIQADIKTIAAHRLFAETAVTALTAQNTLGVTDVLDVDPAFVSQQIDAVFEAVSYTHLDVYKRQGDDGSFDELRQAVFDHLEAVVAAYRGQPDPSG